MLVEKATRGNPKHCRIAIGVILAIAYIAPTAPLRMESRAG
jgi:hypothetical protein